MADTVGEAYVKIRTDSRGMHREVAQALEELGREADKAGEKAGKDFGDKFGEGARKGIEDSGLSGGFEDLRRKMDEVAQTRFGALTDDLKRMGETDRELLQQYPRLAQGEFRWKETIRETNREMIGRRSHIQTLLGDMRDFINRDEDLGRSFRRTAVRFGGFLGHMQSFGRLIRTGSIDIRNWRAGLLAVTDTILGFGKTAYKAALALGPLAGGLSSIAGIATAFAGSLQTGIIGGLAALGPLAIAGGAAMLVLGQGIKAFGKHATDAQKAAVKPIKDQFVALQKVIQGNLFANVDQQAKLLIPTMGLLKTAMGGVATAVSNTATGFLAVIGPGGQAGTAFSKLANALPSLVQKLGQVVINLGSGFIGAMQAALPYATRLANSLITLTSRFSAFANSAKGQSALGSYFERGYQSASKIMRILGTLGKALFQILDIGDKQSGQSFLDAMLASVQKFNNYVHSAQGIQDLKKWFDDARYAAHSLSGAFSALGKTFGQLDTSQTRDQFREIVDFASQLITGFGNLAKKVQETTGPLSSLGGSAGGAWAAIKELAITVGNLYNAIAETGGSSVLATLLDDIALAAKTVNGIFTLLAPVIKAVAGAFAALPGPIQSAIGQLIILNRLMSIGLVRSFATRIAGAGTALATMGTKKAAVSGLARGMGLLSKLASPAGIAIGLTAVALGVFAAKQHSAAQAAAEHRAEVTKLFKTMQDSKSTMNTQVKATAAQIVADKGLFAIGNKLGLSEKTVLGAALGQTQARKDLGKAYQMYQTQVEKAAGANKQYSTEESAANKKTQDMRDATVTLTNALGEINSSLTDAQAKWLATAQAQSQLQNATAAVNPLIQDLTKQMDTFADSTQTATTRTDAFSSALNELTDKSMSTEEAHIKQADALRSLDQQFKTTKNSQGQIISQGENLRKAFIGNTTSINENSKAASDLYQNFQGNVVPAFADVVRAAFDAAGGVKNLGPATKAAQAAAASFDSDLRTKLTKSLHLSGAQADALIQKFHLLPSDTKMLMTLLGGKATEAQLAEILKRAKNVGQTPIQLQANAEAAVKTATDLQKKIDQIRQGKVPGLKANSAQGKATIAQLQTQIDKIRQATATPLRANPNAASATIKVLQKQLDNLLQKHPTALKADKNPAHAEAVALLGEINAMKATVPVHADTAPATADVENWHPPDRIVKIFAQQGNAATRYATTGAMTGAIVDSPQFRMVGERGLREAIVPLDLPLNRVSPEVRQMSALLRGGAGSKSNSNGATSTKVQTNTINVYPQASDAQAVATSLLNRLTVMGR